MSKLLLAYVNRKILRVFLLIITILLRSSDDTALVSFRPYYIFIFLFMNWKSLTTANLEFPDENTTLQMRILGTTQFVFCYSIEYAKKLKQQLFCHTYVLTYLSSLCF